MTAHSDLRNWLEAYEEEKRELFLQVTILPQASELFPTQEQLTAVAASCQLPDSSRPAAAVDYPLPSTLFLLEFVAWFLNSAAL